MKPADRMPNHIIALEALCSPGLFDPRSDRFVITTQLPIHHPGAALAGDEDSCHAAATAQTSLRVITSRRLGTQSRL